MKKMIPQWQIAGFLFTGTLGTFLHFLFDLTDASVVAALVSAVNESIWEHMKLLFYPMILFALIEKRAFRRKSSRFWCVKLTGIVVGLALIPVLYYTYTGILGVSADWINITIFFLAAGVAFWVEYTLFEKERVCLLGAGPALILLVVIVAAFTLLTFFSPHIPFFRDPITGTYGFQPLP